MIHNRYDYKLYFGLLLEQCSCWVEECEVGQNQLEQEQEGPSHNLDLFVMVCEFRVEIVARWILLSILQVSQGIHSWVDHVEPQRWDQAHGEAVEVLEWVIWGIVESPQDLVWSESVSVMVGVSLDSEENWRREGVPGVHLGNRLVDSVLVLHSLETVVLDVVDELKEEHSHHCVVNLVLEGLPSEKEENCEANGGMKNKVHDHLVVGKHDCGWDIVSELLLNSLDLSLP